MEDVVTRVKKAEFVPSGELAAIEDDPGFFGMITQEVMDDMTLGAGEKILYAVITAVCHAKGYCWATNAYFERCLKRNVATIRRWLTALRDRNYVGVEYIVDEETGEHLERRIYPLMNAHRYLLDFENGVAVEE